MHDCKLNLSNPNNVPSWIDRAARTGNFDQDGISFTSNFACGNGQYFKKIAPLCYSFQARMAKQRYTYRFYLKIESQKMLKNIKLRVVDFKDTDPPMKESELAAMYSYDNKIWESIPLEDINILPDYWEADEDYNTEKEKAYSVEYNLKPEKFPVWVASPMPYTIEGMTRLIKDVAEHGCGEVTTIGKTPCGLDVPMITFKNSSIRDNDRPKKVFVICQHPDEVAGMLAIEGMIRELLVSPELCRSTVFYYVPMVNMDGFYFGRTRVNCCDDVGCNLNDDWADLSQSETKHIFAMIQSVKPDIFIDCHNGRFWDMYRYYRLQCFLPTSENFSFVSSLKSMLLDWNKKKMLVVKEEGRPGLSSIEVVRGNFARVGFVFENILVVDPSEENYLTGGKTLLHAVVRALRTSAIL